MTCLNFFDFNYMIDCNMGCTLWLILCLINDVFIRYDFLYDYIMTWQFHITNYPIDFADVACLTLLITLTKHFNMACLI